MWDGVASEIRSIVDPVTLKLMITAAFGAYVGLLILPEPVTKMVAVALTAFLIAYVGLEVFFNILDGWRELSRSSERAVSFRELEDAGHRFGDVMGRDGARVIIMAVTAALGGGAANLASKAPTLPAFARAVLAARTNAGFELSVALEGGARSVTVAEGVMTVGVAPNVLAAVAVDSPGRAIRPGGPGSDAAKGLDWDAVVPTKGMYAGQSRVDQVRLHNVDNPAKPSHGVFFDDGVQVTNEAWARAQRMGLTPDSTGTLKVPMGRQVGVLGGVEGSAAYVPLNSVTIKVVPGTNKIITAFPDL